MAGKDSVLALYIVFIALIAVGAASLILSTVFPGSLTPAFTGSGAAGSVDPLFLEATREGPGLYRMNIANLGTQGDGFDVFCTDAAGVTVKSANQPQYVAPDSNVVMVVQFSQECKELTIRGKGSQKADIFKL